jgi:hypothetical protein
MLEERYRLAPQLREYDRSEPFLRPYLTFSARPMIRSSVLNTDAEGFRVSSSPAGPVDSARWLEGGGGGLVLGGSFTFGIGATCDAATVPSQLASLLGTAQLNVGVCAGNSLQELIAALPFLHATTTVVVCGGVNTILAGLQSLGLNETFGPLFFESALAGLGTAPIGRMLQLATGAARSDRMRPPRVPPRSGDGAGLEERLDRALGRLLRDVRVLSRASRDGARVLFCLQPFASPALRELRPEERRLLEVNARQEGAWSAMRDFMTAHWEWSARRLSADCSTLGVQFLDLSARRFTGWSFLDHVHMTDDGYRQVAELVAEALG